MKSLMILHICWCISNEIAHCAAITTYHFPRFFTLNILMSSDNVTLKFFRILVGVIAIRAYVTFALLLVLLFEVLEIFSETDELMRRFARIALVFSLRSTLVVIRVLLYHQFGLTVTVVTNVTQHFIIWLLAMNSFTITTNRYLLLFFC